MGGSISIESLPDLTGKNVVITGASSGIGEFVTGVLARRGATVYMACRSEEKTNKVIESLRALYGDSLSLHFVPLNLSSLKSVDECASALLARDIPIHLLICNAGVMACPLAFSEDRVELQFATNHLGHFHLVNRLLPAVERAASADFVPRVVVTSSLAHTWAYKGDGLLWDHLRVGATCDGYSLWGAYGQSKLCNILFAKALAQRLTAEQKPVIVNAIHPGYVATDLQRNMYDAYGTLGSIAGWVGYRFAKNVEQGSMSTVYAAVNPEIVENKIHGRYIVPPGKLGSENANAMNLENAEKLWQVSESLVNEILGAH